MFDIDNKDKLCTFKKINIVYQSVWFCNKISVGRTGNIQLNRINQHLPKILLNKITNGNNNRKNEKIQGKIYSNLANGESLVDNENCFENYDFE